jgi:2',3'-cyclic-nucleotide 2'-phosphodiesterase (5'-nucleotidase family)
MTDNPLIEILDHATEQWDVDRDPTVLLRYLEMVSIIPRDPAISGAINLARRVIEEMLKKPVNGSSVDFQRRQRQWRGDAFWHLRRKGINPYEEHVPEPVKVEIAAMVGVGQKAIEGLLTKLREATPKTLKRIRGKSVPK